VQFAVNACACLLLGQRFTSTSFGELKKVNGCKGGVKRQAFDMLGLARVRAEAVYLVRRRCSGLFIPSAARNLLLKREWGFYIYILASKSRRIYVGMINSLFRRVMRHKSGEIEGFTKRYKINRLVYYKVFKYVKNCIARETQLKSGSRAKKRGIDCFV
jgi:putative endonuclease